MLFLSAICEITAQNSGAYSVQVGDGQISGISPNNTAGRWMNLTPGSSGTSSQNPNTNYPGGSTLQGYVDQTGLQIRQIEYPLGVLNFGVTSTTQFPSFSVPLFYCAPGRSWKGDNARWLPSSVSLWKGNGPISESHDGRKMSFYRKGVMYVPRCYDHKRSRWTTGFGASFVVGDEFR